MSERYLGESIPKLGFGCMRLPMKDGAIDMPQFKKMVDAFMEQGFRYFDTAYGYLDGKSEGAVKEAVVDRYPRDQFFLATKMPLWTINETADYEVRFAEQLSRTGAGYFDFYLLHNLSGDQIEKTETLGGFDFLKSLKEKGLARHIGFSYHDTAARLDELLTKHPEVEFVQLQINYADWESESVQSRLCYETVRKHGKSVVIMEPVKGGSLALMSEKVQGIFKGADPDASVASWAIRFAASLDGVITVLSGMSNEEQMADNLSTVKNFKPLTEDERKIIAQVTEILDNTPTVPCTDCKYCTENCPQGIKIPAYISAYNNYKIFANKDGFKGRLEMIKKESGDLSDCLACGVCEGRCPQHIGIIDLLKEIAEAAK